MIWWVLGGCFSPTSPAEDARLFADAMRNAADAESFAVCERIGDQQTRAECQFVVATDGATKAGEAPESRCQRVPRGVWRDECWFDAAETWRRQGDGDRAGELCVKSGRFSVDCRQHLYQSELRAAVHKVGVPFDQLLLEAKPVYCRWAPVLSEADDFEQRFWTKAWHGAHFSQPDLDLTRCEVLARGDREYCEKAGAELLASEFARVLVMDPQRVRFCEDPQAIRLETRWVPSEGLSAVVDELQALVCSESPKEPLLNGMPVVTPKRGTETSVSCNN